jgi:hypothetical protein
MNKLLTKEEFQELPEGTAVSVQYVGSPRAGVCRVTESNDAGYHGVNPAVFNRTDISALTLWLNNVGSDKLNTHVWLVE